MKRVFNFAPGPSMMPLEVLRRAADDMPDLDGSGQSAMEMSHRSKDFAAIIEKAEERLRRLMNIPSGYTALFLQGGAWTQFSMAPINLAGVEPGSPRKKATYIDSGIWAAKAAEEAAKYVDVRVGASSRAEGYAAIPAPPPARADDAYYYICLNNTIMGTRWTSLPPSGIAPLVADISSCILSEPLDVSRFGLLFACAQKNLGPAGCTVVIIRDDLIRNPPSWTPATLSYKTHAKERSLFNTPPCYAIYIIGLMLEWIEGAGGVDGIYARNREKAALLYGYIEGSPFYDAPVKKEDRSLMNVRFGIRARDGETRARLEARFAAEAGAAGLANLAGHRLAGGLRASIYNAMPKEGVAALVDFMRRFEKENGAAALL